MSSSNGVQEKYDNEPEIPCGFPLKSPPTPPSCLKSVTFKESLCHFNALKKALAASQEDREERKNEGISAARGLQSYWSCQLGEPVFDIFVAKFSRDLGPGGVDIVVLGERTLFTLREQGTVRLQKFLGYQPVCITKYVVEAAPGEEGAELTGRTVQENDEGFASIVEEENLIIGTDSDQLMMYKVRVVRSTSIKLMRYAGIISLGAPIELLCHGLP